jgi:hypothetical protein
MATLKIKDPRTITIKILPNKKRIQLRFNTVGAGRYESVEFELDSIFALGFASETLKLLSPGYAPVSPGRVRSAGRPKSRVVKGAG